MSCQSRYISKHIFVLPVVIWALLYSANSTQAADAIFGKWSDSPDKKTCEIPVGASPDKAMLYQITPRGIGYYEIDCAARDITFRADGADFELDCFKGGAAARWFETASVRLAGLNRLTVSFLNQRPPLYETQRTETLYRCPLEKQTELPKSEAVYSQWDHNGSVMSMSEDQGNIEIEYTKPRPGMFAVGVRPGTTLFFGLRNENQVEGTAYVFIPKCGPIGFQVKGQFLNRTSTLVLSGGSPRTNRDCEVTKEVSEVLHFERLP